MKITFIKPVKFKMSILLLVTSLVVLGFYGYMGTGKAEALSGSDFNAARIMDDGVFYNSNTMTVNQIQNFLNSKVPNCDTNGEKMIYDPSRGDTVTRKTYAQRRGVSTPFVCLKNYTQNTQTITNGGSDLCTSSIPGGNKSAARIIHDVAKACNINPQALIVLLQKEQGLVTDDWPWPTQYRTATGYGCPDTAPCNAEYFGFFNQVYQASQAFRRYRANPDNYNYKAGRNNKIYWHQDLSRCGSSTVFIQNQATAGLYTYTPYRPNKAALDNLDGTGDSCSAYGNRNFWRDFNAWFSNPITKPTPFFRIGNTDPIYILGTNNNYYHVPSWNVLNAYGYGKTFDTIAVKNNSYVDGLTKSGSLSVIAQFESAPVYLIDGGRKHHFKSGEVLYDVFGYNSSDVSKLPIASEQYVQTSDSMKTVVKERGGSATFFIDDGKKHHIIDGDAYSSGDPTYSSLPKLDLSKYYLTTLNNGPIIIAPNKLLKRSDDGSFMWWDGSKLYDIKKETAQEMGVSPHYSVRPSNIKGLAQSDTDAIGNLVKNDQGELFILDRNKKLSVEISDLSNFGLSENDFNLTPSAFLNLVNSERLSSAVRINNGAAIYLIKNGHRHHFKDRRAMTENGYSSSDVTNINSRSSQLFPDSGKGIFSTGTLFRIGSTAKVYFINDLLKRTYIPSMTIFNQLGFSKDKIISVKDTQITDYVLSGTNEYYAKKASGQVWLIHSGKYRNHVSGTMASSTKYDLDTSAVPVFKDDLITSYARQSSLTDLIKAKGDDRVYLIEDGAKRWVTSGSTFEEYGGQSNLTLVSKPFIESLRTGPKAN